MCAIGCGPAMARRSSANGGGRMAAGFSSRCGCRWRARAAEVMQTLRTLIVDDEPLAIERLQILAGQQEGVSLVGTASARPSDLRLVAALPPDLLLRDIATPDLHGPELPNAIHQLYNPPAAGLAPPP